VASGAGKGGGTMTPEEIKAAAKNAARDSVMDVARAVTPEIAEIASKLADVAKAMTAEIAPQLAAIDAQWQAEYGEPPPQTHEELIRWARRAGYTPERFDQATGAELFAWIEGEILRLRGSDVKPQGEVTSYVTLLQMAASVNRSKATLKRLFKVGKLPSPAIKGCGGKPNEWRWDEVRPVLEAEFDKILPVTFPADKFVRF